MHKNILLVEDEQTTIFLINSFVQDMGFNIIKTVGSGELAVHEVKNLSPDLVLMDIILDGKLDGIDATQKIKEINNVPVVFMTSSSDSDTVKRALLTNPSGYIVKPVDKKELKSVIELALLRHEMEEKLKESELRFFTILNSIGDAVFVIDNADLITYVNPVAEKITERSVDRLLGKRFNDVMNINYDGLHTTEDPLEEHIPFNYFTRPSGKQLPVDFTISPISDMNGVKAGSVIVLRDDTERVNSELKLKESYYQIKKAVTGIILAMAQMLETRDPYTAGHQRRVADIARSIANMMELPQKQIEGIYMASLIHDLGKIYIPFEILSKPGRLTSIEFELIHTHPQAGYDILKTIDFPWPLAEIVYQHHEYLNGSGYPRGLSGGSILLESRILSVADVVEAMASHRPYRPSLGIDRALQEISDKKRFDTDVAAICIKLFKEENYVMQ